VRVVDFNALRNMRLYDGEGVLRRDAWHGPPPLAYDDWASSLATDGIRCLVATSDFGGPYLMRDWNRYCVEEGVHFLPVVLDKFVGTVGQLVIPGETACYECFRLRENANMDSAEIQRAAEKGAGERQGIVGFHPAMAGMLGEVAAMELTKLYGGGVPWSANRVIEIRLLVPSMTTRRVLKLPRCPVCSTTRTTSSVYLDKESFVPGHQLNYHEFR
jgi:thiazole/oxazole-forming peptide maturase SagC family component